jgi:hypothetical protein
MSDDSTTPPADDESLGHKLARVSTAVAHAFLGTEPTEDAVRPPSKPTKLHVTAKTPTSISVAWNASVGSKPVHYTIYYRLHGAKHWSVGAATGAVCAGTVHGLKQKTEYDLEIFAHYA